MCLFTQNNGNALIHSLLTCQFGRWERFFPIEANQCGLFQLAFGLDSESSRLFISWSLT